MSYKYEHYGKKRRLTPKRKKLIDEVYPRYERYIKQMKQLGIYEGIYWSADRKNKPIHIDTKEKFTEHLLYNCSLSFNYYIRLP